jgi:hypothetical protein
VKSGIPYDVAFAMCPTDTSEVALEEEALALSVCFGEAEGGVFNWDTLSWVERNG